MTDHPVKIGDSSGSVGEREAREDEQRFISGTGTRAEQWLRLTKINSDFGLGEWELYLFRLTIICNWLMGIC